MPVYEYRCPRCGMDIEMFSSIASRPAVIRCAECGADALRVFSVPNIRTEDNNPHRRSRVGALMGVNGLSRREARAKLEHDGIVVTSVHDRDIAHRAASQRRAALSKEADAVAEEYARLPSAHRALITDGEYRGLPDADRQRFPKSRVVRDTEAV